MKTIGTERAWNLLLEGVHGPEPRHSSWGPEVVVGAPVVLLADLKERVQGLEFRWRMILCARYGLLDGEWRSLDEVAKLIWQTRERVRQLEAHALRLLRGSPGGWQVHEVRLRDTTWQQLMARRVDGKSVDMVIRELLGGEVA